MARFKVRRKIGANFGKVSKYLAKFGKVYDRMGSLFIPSMKCELVEGDESLKKVVHYIHANPIHHGFVDHIEKWKHSS